MWHFLRSRRYALLFVSHDGMILGNVGISPRPSSCLTRNNAQRRFGFDRISSIAFHKCIERFDRNIAHFDFDRLNLCILFWEIVVLAKPNNWYTNVWFASFKSGGFISATTVKVNNLESNLWWCSQFFQKTKILIYFFVHWGHHNLLFEIFWPLVNPTDLKLANHTFLYQLLGLASTTISQNKIQKFNKVYLSKSKWAMFRSNQCICSM